MSENVKRKLAGLTLILFFLAGAVLLGVQIRKYYLGELDLTINELIVTAVAVSLVVNPKFLLNGINKVVNANFKGNSNDNRKDNDRE